MPYCNECGAELKESDLFCPKCGHPTEKADSNNANSSREKINSDSLDSIKGKVNAGDLSSITEKLNMKIIGAALVVLLLIIGGLALFGGSSNGGDLADVTNVDIIAKTNYAIGTYMDNGNMDRIGTVFTFSFMPKEDIDRVTGLRFDNLELTYSDGSVDKIAGSGHFDYQNTYFASTEYSYEKPFKIPQDDVVAAYNSITHINGEIVAEKADGSEVIIAHVDEDVNLKPYPS